LEKRGGLPKIHKWKACMLDKDDYLEKYNLKETFEKSDLNWDVLEEIYEDYTVHKQELNEVCVKLETYIVDNIKSEFGSESSLPYHSIRGRVKDAEHLIEKIIRKRGKEHSHKYEGISKDNYMQIIRDTIGIRLLIFKKEEWEQIYDFLSKLFQSGKSDDICMAERPIAYTRYGDRDIYKDKIYKEHSNRGYRSQHYIVRFNGVYCEIQVRTLAEEVYGEFDHRVKYPYREDNKFLIRYTGTLAQLLDSVDELISTCEQLRDGWEDCGRYYDDDEYIDWTNISMKSEHIIEKESTDEYAELPDKIDAKDYVCDSMLRKGMQ